MSSSTKNKKIEAPTTILLPRFDSYGDLVLFEGFVHSLLERFPHAEICLLVREGYDQLKVLFPDRLSWRTTSFNPYSLNAYKNIDDIHQLLNEISTQQWDLVIFGMYSRTFVEELIAAKLLNSNRIAFDGQNQTFPWPQHLLTTLGLSASNNINLVVTVEEMAHEADKYAALWNAIFEDDTTVLPSTLNLPEALATKADNALQEMELVKGRYVVCLPAGTQNVKIKMWPTERYAEVLAFFYAEYAQKPLLVGHIDERPILEKLANLLDDRGISAKIWCGATGDLGVLAVLFKGACLYLGNDSGPAHIAEMLGIPTVVIFGGGHWPRFAPTRENAKAVYCYLPCYYCMWECVFDDAPCVRLIGVDDVKNAVTTLFNGTNKDRLYQARYSVPTEASEFFVKKYDTQKAYRLQMSQQVIRSLSENLKSCEEAKKRELEQTISAMQLSLSLRITSPLRFIVNLIRKVLF